MDTICAFSSDRRPLYTADIYRVLALPTGHIVHFRYKKKYVDDNLLETNAKLKGQRVAIFFTHGNEDENEATQLELEHFSIRWATIADFEVSKDTDVFHAYLKLESFCNVSFEPMSLSDDHTQPIAKFFTTLRCTEIDNENNWQSRINAIKDSFPSIIFFHLKGIYDGGKKLSLKYQDKKRSCFYNLIHGNRYILKIALGNPNLSRTKIELLESSEEISINAIHPIESSVDFDDYDIPISVKTLQVKKQASLLKFKPLQENEDLENIDLGEYATNIELNLTLSTFRSILFGLFSTLAFGMLLLAKPVSISAVWPPTYTLVISITLFWISTSYLYSSFNKK